MGHVPHLYLPGSWEAPEIAVPDSARHHLERVLRRHPAAAVSYTDGRGVMGEGRFESGVVVRGTERSIPVPPRVSIAVSPPKATDRQRFLVEKLAEIGATELIWLTTARTEGRPVRHEKAAAWAVGALEQSRGAHLLAIDGPRGVADLAGRVLIADPSGDTGWWPARDVTIAVGPEGGLTDDEVLASPKTVSLGHRTLRTETAGVVAAVLALSPAR